MAADLPQVLIVDDEASVREFLCEALLPCCRKVVSVESLKAALQALQVEAFDVVLTDICMPGASGLDLLALAQQLNWDCAVILMTGHAELDNVLAGARLHAADFLVKPFGTDTLCYSITTAFEKLKAGRKRRKERELLAAGLQERTEQLTLTQHLLSATCRSALESLVATLGAREPETYAHSFRVRAYALHLALLMGYPDNELPQLGSAALLHDMGKVAISDAILLKPGPLTPKEFELLKAHSAAGERIINRMGFLGNAGKIVRHHHERWDGRGYPDGLAGAAIPLGSRLFAVADTLDAMTSNRCYRKAASLDIARREIAACSGTQFDPAIASAFCRVSDNVWRQLWNQADTHARTAIIPDLRLGSFPVVATPLPLFPVTPRS